MKGIVYEGPDTLTYRDVPDVTPRRGEVKIRVRACGICGSDVHGYMGITGRRTAPMIMGHEFAGEIAGLGKMWKGGSLGTGYLSIRWIFAGTVKCAKKARSICV